MNQTILKHKSEKEALNYKVTQAEDNGTKLLDEIILLKNDNEVD